jgi:hypothetical protein
MKLVRHLLLHITLLLMLLERGEADNHFVEAAAEGPQVCFVIVLFAEKYLGGDVVDGVEDSGVGHVLVLEDSGVLKIT